MQVCKYVVIVLIVIHIMYTYIHEAEKKSKNHHKLFIHTILHVIKHLLWLVEVKKCDCYNYQSSSVLMITYCTAEVLLFVRILG